MFSDKNISGKNIDTIEIVDSFSISFLLEKNGNNNIKFCFPFSLDIGKLNKIEEFDRSELKEYLKLDLNYDFKDLFNKLSEYVSKSNKIRVWSSIYDTEEYLLLLFICHHFKDKNISVIFSNEIRDANRINCLDKDEIKEIYNKEHILSDLEKEKYNKEWIKIINSNKELRFMNNGVVQSVDINYFDNVILERLNKLGKVEKRKLIMDLISNPIVDKCQYADFILEYLIDNLIKKGLINSTIEDNIEIKEIFNVK